METWIDEFGVKYEKDEKGVVSLVDAPKNCKEYIIPDSVAEIGFHAFVGCSELTSVNIPDSVIKIGIRAFVGCSGLTSVNIPNSVTEIGVGAFEGCSGLTSVNIPNSVTEIGQGAFSKCTGLKSVNIPASVIKIGASAFYGCSGLTSVNIPNSVTEIGIFAFYGCSGLTSINIPASVIKIGASAFEGCPGLVTHQTKVKSDPLRYLKQLQEMFDGMWGRIHFRNTNPKFPSQYTGVFYIGFSDISAWKYTIREKKSNEKYDDDNDPIVATYESMKSILLDGWEAD